MQNNFPVLIIASINVIAAWFVTLMDNIFLKYAAGDDFVYWELMGSLDGSLIVC